jgi:3-oxoacyl-[acyl-carrier-protein] synthase-3
MAINIIGTGRAVPPKRVSNDDLAALVDTSDEWIRSHTGIGFRHMVEGDTACSDLATEAAKNAMAMAADAAGEDPAHFAETIDMIVLGTASPDYFGTPSTACVVQHNIGAKNAAAFDLSAGCTGFVYGLETAAGLLNISADRKRALVIGSEVLSKMINWDDRGTCVLFGDGAGAVVLEKAEGKSGLQKTLLYADGSGSESLLYRRGGTRNPLKKGETYNEMPICVEMNGQEVYNFAVKAITDTLDALLKSQDVKIEDIAHIVPHQANARIVQAAAKRLRIPLERFYMNIEEYANTSAATIPIALDELNRAGKLKKGDLILTVGFGGGLTYGGNIIIW